MRSTKNLGKGLMVGMTIVLMALPVWAGNNGKGSSSGKGSGDRTQSRSKDCQGTIDFNQEGRLLVANPILDHVRVKSANSSKKIA